MSPTLTDASPLHADPADGLAVLEQRKSQAETFGIPLAVLAELTHRCPLQCPYCSNPVELERGGAELTTDEWKRVLSELAAIGVLLAATALQIAAIRSEKPARSPPPRDEDRLLSTTS